MLKQVKKITQEKIIEKLKIIEIYQYFSTIHNIH
jgi:hypothetical protein